MQEAGAPAGDTYLLTAIDQPASEGMYFAPPPLPRGTKREELPGPQKTETEESSWAAPRWLQVAVDFVAQPTTGPPLVHAAHYCPSISGPHA
eukprot:s1557_g8.t1